MDVTREHISRILEPRERDRNGKREAETDIKEERHREEDKGTQRGRERQTDIKRERGEREPKTKGQRGKERGRDRHQERGEREVERARERRVKDKVTKRGRKK